MFKMIMTPNKGSFSLSSWEIRTPRRAQFSPKKVAVTPVVTIEK